MKRNSAQYSLSRERRIERFMTSIFLNRLVAARECLRPFSLPFGNKNGVRIMTYFIFARDGTSRIVLKRDTREAAEKKARELKDLGWFDVQIEQTAASQAA